MKLDFWSILTIVIIFQRLFFASVLWFSPKKRMLSKNIFLTCIIIVFTWFLIEFLSIRNVYKVNLNLFYGTRYGSWLILGPLTFFFFKSITTINWKLNWRQLWHFIPFILFVILIPTISKQSLSSRQIHYGMLAVFDHRPKTVTLFEYVYSTVFYLQFIHLGCYLFFNIKLTNTYVKRLKHSYSNINQVIWLKVFNALLVLTLILASLYLYLLFVSDHYRRALDYIYVIPVGIFIYSVGYHISGISWLKVDGTNRKYAKSSLKKEVKPSYIQQLETLMDTDKPYLKNDLRLADLALLLEIKNHHLSQLINEHYQCAFFDYINRYRLEEAKRLIQEKPKETLLKIAFDSGFNNKTSFINAFKKFESKTPSLYRKQMN